MTQTIDQKVSEELFCEMLNPSTVERAINQLNPGHKYFSEKEIKDYVHKFTEEVYKPLVHSYQYRRDSLRDK